MHPFFDLPHPIVFGHRGASGEVPENTLPAFQRALAQGADVIETDVHRSRDGQVVIAHDCTLLFLFQTEFDMGIDYSSRNVSTTTDRTHFQPTIVILIRIK